MDTTDKLNQSTERLKETKRELYETEDIAITTMRDLRGQTDQIRRTRGRLDDVDSNLGVARNLITTMTRRAYANKAILSVVAALILLVLLYVIVRKITG